MEKKVLIIASGEGFIIKGLETKLSGMGVAAAYSPLEVKEIKGRCDDTGLFIIFTDDAVGSFVKQLVFIKEHCSEKNKQIIVVGTKEEYDVLKSYIPEGLVYMFFERPLDMEKLLEEISKYLDDDARIARRKSILIVDDDVTYMSMIMDWLKDLYKVSMVNSGTKAITWLAKNHADLVLLDYEMPETSGPQVLQMIRSDSELSDIPVMFLTGNGDKDCIMKVVGYKPAGYLLKSVEKVELREKLTKFFATHKP